MASPVSRSDLSRADGSTLLIRTNFDEGGREWLLRQTGPLHFTKGEDTNEEGHVGIILAASPDGSRVQLWGAEFNRSEWTETQARYCFDFSIRGDHMDRGGYEDAL